MPTRYVWLVNQTELWPVSYCSAKYILDRTRVIQTACTYWVHTNTTRLALLVVNSYRSLSINWWPRSPDGFDPLFAANCHCDVWLLCALITEQLCSLLLKMSSMIVVMNGQKYIRVVGVGGWLLVVAPVGLLEPNIFFVSCLTMQLTVWMCLEPTRIPFWDPCVTRWV